MAGKCCEYKGGYTSGRRRSLLHMLYGPFVAPVPCCCPFACTLAMIHAEGYKASTGRLQRQTEGMELPEVTSMARDATPDPDAVQQEIV